MSVFDASGTTPVLRATTWLGLRGSGGRTTHPTRTRPVKRLVLAAILAAGIVLGLLPSPAQAVTYVQDVSVQSRLTCQVGSVRVEPPFVYASGYNFLKDGYRDYAMWLPYYKDASGTWRADESKWSSVIYNQDVPGVNSMNIDDWRFNGSNVLMSSWTQSFPWYTTVAAQLYVRSGRDGVWRYSWAQNSNTSGNYCTVFGTYWNGYTWTLSTAPQYTSPVGGSSPV